MDRFLDKRILFIFFSFFDSFEPGRTQSEQRTGSLRKFDVFLLRLHKSSLHPCARGLDFWLGVMDQLVS